MASSRRWKLLVRRGVLVAALREHGIQIDNESLRHPSPVGWEHLNLTGDYTWQTTRRLAGEVQGSQAVRGSTPVTRRP